MYLTLINRETHLSVPFERVNGEFKILSSNIKDTEDNVEVRLTDMFYEYSVDFNNFYSKTGV